MSIRPRDPADVGAPVPLLRFTTMTPSGTNARVLSLYGEVDQDRRRQLHDALAEAVRAGPPRLVVDLSGLTFCDSTGLNALLQTRLDADAAGVRLLLAAPPPNVMRLLEITGTAALFTIRGSVPAALVDQPLPDKP
ncbi:STAS domain-containing protein [Streptomyces sp. M-16]|uniref:STAS domain-containing protein n=1 Tax=Streptomyces sp. M-16 TaxID=3233040 RepID=UPI002256196A